MSAHQKPCRKVTEKGATIKPRRAKARARITPDQLNTPQAATRSMSVERPAQAKPKNRRTSFEGRLVSSVAFAFPYLINDKW